jgi:hypothetical protein
MEFVTRRDAQRGIRKQIQSFCDLAARSSAEKDPYLRTEGVMYWLTAAVYWWGFIPEPFLPVRR